MRVCHMCSHVRVFVYRDGAGAGGDGGRCDSLVPTRKLCARTLCKQVGARRGLPTHERAHNTHERAHMAPANKYDTSDKVNVTVVHTERHRRCRHRPCRRRCRQVAARAGAIENYCCVERVVGAARWRTDVMETFCARAAVHDCVTQK